MGITDTGLFALAERRLAWTDKRQGVLAQNVANANTPGFRAKDLKPFAAALGNAELSRTSALHLAPASGEEGLRTVLSARSPNGNGVSLEDQLVQVADTSSAQELTLNLYRRYQAMFRTALGRGS